MTTQRLLLIVLFVILGTTSAFAQRRGQMRPRSSGSIERRLELTVLGGYQFGGHLDGFNGEYSLNDSESLTAIGNFTLRPGFQFEFMYNRQATQEQFRPFVGGIKQTLWDATVQYFQFGGLGYVDAGAAEPFAVATLGWTDYGPNDPSVSGETKFSSTFGLGTKIFPSNRVGVRLEGRLMMTFMETALGLGCGTGGCSGGFYGWGVLQGALSGGVSVGF